MVCQWVISPRDLLLNGLYIRVKKPTDPITFDPNFLGHPSLGGGFNYFLFSSLLGEDSQFD